MTLSFAIIALIISVGAVGAMVFRNLVHCALSVAVAFAGLALAYLQLDAQFVGLTQVLVYVGAVAILIVFAVLLTRGGETPERSVFSTSWLLGLAVAAGVFGILFWAIKHSFASESELASNAQASVKQIGDALMTRYVLPLEVIGLLLTAALIGAVIIALREDHK